MTIQDREASVQVGVRSVRWNNRARAANLSVCMVSVARCLPILRTVVTAWLDLGCEVICATPVHCSDLPQHPRLRVLQRPATPLTYGDNLQDAIDLASHPNVYIGADDVIPCGGDWAGVLAETGSALQALHLQSVTGQRWGDWATFDGDVIRNVPWNFIGDGLFVAANALLLRDGAARRISWRGRGFHDGDDILVCWEAANAGIPLLPPRPDGPVLVHLDRLPSSPADPDRLGVCLLSGANRGFNLQHVVIGGISFVVRPSTWDADIAREVIDGDFYLMGLWQPAREPRFIVDVGAHIGAFSALAAARWPGATIIASEAYARNALLAHVNTRCFENVRLRHEAVTAASGTIQLVAVPGPNTGGHGVNLDFGQSGDVRSAPAVTLAELARREGIDVIDFLKLDCEGSEWEIVPQIGQDRDRVAVHLVAMELHLDPARGRTLEAMQEMLHREFSAVHVRRTGSKLLWRVHAMR